MCPPYGYEFWCGNATQMSICQTSSTAPASLNVYRAATVLGVLPGTSVSSPQTNAATTPSDSGSDISSSGSASITSSATPGTTSPAIGGPTASPTASSTRPDQTNSRTATAIGAGLGVPLGIAVVGFLAFRFWKESRRRDTMRSPELNPGRRSSEFGMAVNEQSSSNACWELDNRARKVELPTR